MISSTFWPLVDLLGGEPSPEGLERLQGELASRGGEAAEQFEDDLAEAVHTLDTPAHLHQPVHDHSEPTGVPALPMSSDVFLYARLAVVAAGESAWQRVAADPAALAGRWAVADAEALLYVAGEAYEQATGLLWEHRPPLGMETGDNHEAWGTAPPDAGGEEADDESDSGWLHVVSGADVGIARSRAYDGALDDLADRLARDPAWQAWWHGSGLATLEVSTFRAREQGSISVRRGRVTARAEAALDWRRLDGLGPRARAELAAADLAAALDAVRAALRLPAPPALPAPRFVDDERPDEVVPAELPGPSDLEAMREQAVAMGLVTHEQLDVMIRTLRGMRDQQ